MTEFANRGYVPGISAGNLIKVTITSTMKVGEVQATTVSTAEFPSGTGAPEIEAAISELRRVHRERTEVPVPIRHVHVTGPIDTKNFHETRDLLTKDLGRARRTAGQRSVIVNRP